ncbi:hypothetical protein M426DRAFT_127643 [Hypoxylon sp. CI-4A]|nr:hypothetical protein M426DRAFT_127643 [Hypoxylon sp. CI-4A]
MQIIVCKRALLNIQHQPTIQSARSPLQTGPRSILPQNYPFFVFQLPLPPSPPPPPLPPPSPPHNGGTQLALAPKPPAFKTEPTILAEWGGTKSPSLSSDSSDRLLSVPAPSEGCGTAGPSTQKKLPTAWAFSQFSLATTVEVVSTQYVSPCTLAAKKAAAARGRMGKVVFLRFILDAVVGYNNQIGVFSLAKERLVG